MRVNEFITEKWTKKYKSSINCSHPKGFSQKAHCAGRKKSNESVAEAVCPDCGLCESHGSGHVQLQEAGMPSSVVKNKQRYVSMSDSDFAKSHKEKSDDELKAMAWRHGYGKGSSHYVNKRNKGQQDVAEATSDPKFDNMLKGITAKKAVAKQQKTDTKQQSRDAFGGMFGGTSSDLTKNLKIREQGVAEGSLNEGQYEMMMRNGQVKKFIAKDDADAKRIAAGHGAKSVIKLRGGVPAGKVSEQGMAEGSLEELANTSLQVKEPKDFVNVNDRKQVTWKVMKFKSGKDTYLINFKVQKSPTSGKKQNWNAVNVGFGVKEKQDDWSFGDEVNTDLTAKNKNQFLIYSTVINAVRKFITEYNTEIDEIIMQGAGERQEAMYQRFFQVAPKYFPGWHHNGKHSLVRDVPRQQAKKVREQGVAEGLFGIDDKIKGKIQNVVSDLSDIPGMWDHKAQTFTDAGMEKLQSVLKNNPKYIKYALNLDYRDYEAEGVAEGHSDQQRKVFKKNGEPVGEVGIDRESSPGNGQWYMKCYAYDIDNSGYDSYEEAVAELKHCMKQGVTEGLDELSRILDLSGLTLAADQQFDIIEDMVESWAEYHGVDAETIWEDIESVDDEELLSESAAWRNSSGKSKTGGLNAKGVASYRRENPGSKLQTAVTTKPSKLKKGSKAAKRRKSFCARMGGVKGPMKKPNGKPTRKALALRKWNC